MQQFNIHQAKTQLSALIERAVRRGESFVIAKAGKPMVKVMPIEEPENRAPRRIGFMKGMFEVPDNFDTMYREEIEALFGVKE